MYRHGLDGGRVDFSNLLFRENLASENVQGYISRNFFQFEFRHDQYGLSQWEFFLLCESHSRPQSSSHLRMRSVLESRMVRECHEIAYASYVIRSNSIP